MVTQRSHKPCVVGSIPTSTTKQKKPMHNELIQQLLGRAAFLKTQGSVKTVMLLEQAAEALRQCQPAQSEEQN